MASIPELTRLLAAIHLRAHQGLALDRDPERIVLLVDEVNPIVNGGREIQHVPKAIARARRTAQGAA